MAVAKEQIRQIISDNSFTSVTDVYDYLKEGFKDILQELMEAEMDATPGYKKTRERKLQPQTKETVIFLYARGMSTRDIHDQIQDLYGMELSAEMVSKITDKILPEAREWQSRPLNPVYPFVFMDCIHYKVHGDGKILSRAAYIIMGVTVDGYKDKLVSSSASSFSAFHFYVLVPIAFTKLLYFLQNSLKNYCTGTFIFELNVFL